MKKKRFSHYYILIVFTVFLLSFEQPLICNGETSNEWGKKDIYLTFDDAPGDKVTEQILDVLKDNNIKATFFVVGNRIMDREKILMRISNEGHSIGLHSYSHKVSKIY